MGLATYRIGPGIVGYDCYKTSVAVGGGGGGGSGGGGAGSSSQPTAAPTARPLNLTEIAYTSRGNSLYNPVATSLDGSILLSSYRTSVDGGNTWSSITGPPYDFFFAPRVAAAASANGSMLLWAQSPGYIFASSKANRTFATKLAGSPNVYWMSLGVSGDGATIIAGSIGPLYLSFDAGATFAPQASMGNRTWVSACVSTDGQTMLAAAEDGVLALSTDAGANFQDIAAARLGSQSRWKTVSCSGNGTVRKCDCVCGAQLNRFRVGFNKAAPLIVIRTHLCGPSLAFFRCW